VAGSAKTPRINFANGLLEDSDLKQPRRFVDFLISLATQAAFVLLLILLPLSYTQAFNLPDLEKAILVAPPPPPRSEVRVVAKPKVSLFDNGKLVAPRAIPKHVQILKEAPEESTGAGGSTGRRTRRSAGRHVRGSTRRNAFLWKSARSAATQACKDQWSREGGRQGASARARSKSQPDLSAVGESHAHARHRCAGLHYRQTWKYHADETRFRAALAGAGSLCGSAAMEVSTDLAERKSGCRRNACDRELSARQWLRSTRARSYARPSRIQNA